MTLNVHLQQLAYFREAIRSESWSTAAKRLHVSQPALSQSLRELERRLDIELFEKVGRRMVLTPLGEEFAVFANSVLAQSEVFAGRLEAMQRGTAGRLRVGMIDAACLYILPRALRAFQQECPNVELQLTVDSSGVLLERLREFDLDLAILVGPIQSEKLRTTLIADERLFICTPRGARGSPARARWILYPAGSRTRRLIDTALFREGVIPNTVVESGNPQVLRQMVAMGFGWSVLPEAVVGNATDLRRPRDEPLTHRRIEAVVRADAPNDPRVARLLELAGTEPSPQLP